MNETHFRNLANHEIVTLAVYLLGGDGHKIDTEDIAKKANDLAPGRFTWRKYADQINIDTVRKRLWDATRADKGGLLKGTEKGGWILTDAGLAFAKQREGNLEELNLSRQATNSRERNWLRRERERMLTSEAYLKFAAGDGDKITSQEAQAFFRIDAYVTGEARSDKLLRTSNVFGGDSELGPLIKLLVSRITGGAK